MAAQQGWNAEPVTRRDAVSATAGTKSAIAPLFITMLLLLVAWGSLFVVIVDGDSCFPLKTGDRALCLRFLSPHKGDLVVFDHPSLGTMIKVVTEDRIGVDVGGAVLHEGELYVAGSNPASQPVGIIQRSCVRGVVRFILISSTGGRSSASAEDTLEQPATIPSAGAQLPRKAVIDGRPEDILRTDRNMSGQDVLRIPGDWTRDYIPGRWTYDVGSGQCLKIAGSFLADPAMGQETVVEVEGGFSGSAQMGLPVFLLDHQIPNGNPVLP
ncbi:hypothetical protein COT78_01890 [Candidatus Berkelbacteria bacterium CG10_big_fil_rev_8_21_14_0_10_43_13]|uniref:Peptidase S26 domain-containing protein n=1 Tax=Candidatus Berkelbacteria bacterium CG10_big_fil_rev_8_21_14_0_10_43_13 TaxID=1974514 RepID=A0A2H0W6J8_9BACT|nr:hypothetical protein [bacterium]PIS07702.1 MAG: hypothetical protein COT78_01890 [Candidatus Berkelbacteria bacterium CG10_big_fil_rev_8_21_14_0_10_43_13]